MRKTIASFAGLFLLSTAMAAHADTYNYTISGGVTGTLSITTGAADPTSNGGLEVTAASGTIDGTPVTFTYDPTVNYGNGGGLVGYDNDLYPTIVPVIDQYGLALSYAGSPFSGIYYQNGSLQFYDGFATSEPIDLTQTSSVAATPEPSSLVLLGTGMLGLAGAARRKYLKA